MRNFCKLCTKYDRDLIPPYKGNRNRVIERKMKSCVDTRSYIVDLFM